MTQPIKEYAVTAFYLFKSLPAESLDSIRSSLLKFGAENKICGLILVAKEGINGTVASDATSIATFKQHLVAEFGEMIFKDSICKKKPFRRFKVKIKPEIVSTGDPALTPVAVKNNHLSPAEWQRAMQQAEEIVVLDTRNTYEVALGKFEGAVDPGLSKFSDFGRFVAESGIPKEKKVLMYCTGGIRCEKAILEMQRQGYSKVFQLEGGILNYLKEFPNSKFLGECFVFDHRVSVDQELAPSKRYALCPHCGDPGSAKIECTQCGKSAVICDKCAEAQAGKTCSKNCAHHATRTTVNVAA